MRRIPAAASPTCLRLPHNRGRPRLVWRVFPGQRSGEDILDQSVRPSLVCNLGCGPSLPGSQFPHPSHEGIGSAPLPSLQRRSGVRMDWSSRRRLLGGEVGIWVVICYPKEAAGLGGEGREGIPDLDVRVSRSFQK